MVRLDYLEVTLKEYTDAMLDVETLGVDPDCVVLSIGIVFFNLVDEDDYETLDDFNRSFYVALNTQDQIDNGRSVTFSTIKWWKEQNVQAQAVFKECEEVERRSLSNAAILGNINSQFGDCKDICLWGNGSGFDNPIFNSLLKTYGLDNPFRFWNDNDLRTLKRMAGAPKLDIVRGTYHNALEDAKYQVLAAQEYHRRVTQA